MSVTAGDQRAISAIDITIAIALWDIKGRALNVPILQLLGGPARTKARIYGHIYESLIDKILVECGAKMEAGFPAFGHLNRSSTKATTRCTSRRISRRCTTPSTTSSECARWWATGWTC